MTRITFALIAAVLALSTARPEAHAEAAAPCPVTIHVSNAGAYSLSSCKGARKTTRKRFHADLEAMLTQAGDPDVVGLDAEPQASFLATMNAMNWAQDVGVYHIRVVDEPGRPPFMIEMPPLGGVVAPVVYAADASEEEKERARAAAPPPPRFISVTVRADHLVDVDLPYAPARPEGRALVSPDPEGGGAYMAKGVRIADLPLLMPPAHDTDLARVGTTEGAGKTRWSDIRGVYRAFAGGGYGRLISEDPDFL